jgi:hypothetical protein
VVVRLVRGQRAWPVWLAQERHVTVPGPRSSSGSRRGLPHTARLSAFNSWTLSPRLICRLVGVVLHGASVSRVTPAPCPTETSVLVVEDTSE